MKLMPEQPTEEMLEAAISSTPEKDAKELLIWAYKQMYAAAPNIEHEEIAKLKREKEDLAKALGRYIPKNAFKDDGRWFCSRMENGMQYEIECSEHATALEALEKVKG